MRIGITHFAQDALGDIVYVSLPEVGDTVEGGTTCGELESTKSVSDVYAPVSGEVVARNESLDATPELVNNDPYGGAGCSRSSRGGRVAARRPARRGRVRGDADLKPLMRLTASGTGRFGQPSTSTRP